MYNADILEKGLLFMKIICLFFLLLAGCSMSPSILKPYFVPGKRIHVVLTAESRITCGNSKYILPRVYAGVTKILRDKLKQRFPGCAVRIVDRRKLREIPCDLVLLLTIRGNYFTEKDKVGRTVTHSLTMRSHLVFMDYSMSLRIARGAKFTLGFCSRERRHAASRWTTAARRCGVIRKLLPAKILFNEFRSQFRSRTDDFIRELVAGR